MLVYEQLLETFILNPEQMEQEMILDTMVRREDLDEERAKHASLFLKWSLLQSMAETKFRKQKTLTDEIIWNQAKQAARSRGEKVSKELAEEYAYLDAAYQKSVETLRKYGEVVDMLKNVEKAMWNRKAMLENMIRKDRQDFYSEPRKQDSRGQELREFFQPPSMSEEELEAKALKALEDSRARRLSCSQS
jgi:hypothetical protein